MAKRPTVGIGENNMFYDRFAKDLIRPAHMEPVWPIPCKDEPEKPQMFMVCRRWVVMGMNMTEIEGTYIHVGRETADRQVEEYNKGTMGDPWYVRPINIRE